MKTNMVCIAAIFVIAAVVLVIAIRKLILFITEKNISAYQSSLIERHYEEVENMYRQTRGWRHDYRTHIQTMKAYLQMKEYDKLDKYLNDLEIDLTTVDTVIKTGNVMIDAISRSSSKFSAHQHLGYPMFPISLPAHLSDLVSCRPRQKTVLVKFRMHHRFFPKSVS